jgi:hypothetical protein
LFAPQLSAMEKRMRAARPLVLALLLAGCGPSENAGAPSSTIPPPAAGPALRLACDGPIGAETSKDSLTRLFGAENVVDQTVPGPEGTQNIATVLYPNDPKKRLEIVWMDEKAKTRPGDASISGADSDWIGPGGLRLGATLEEVERVNGGPFRLQGFGWDYGGFVSNWQGGTLAGAAGCAVTVRFDTAEGADLNGISGEGEILSGNPKVRAAHPHVVRLAIGYAAKTR